MVLIISQIFSERVDSATLEATTFGETGRQPKQPAFPAKSDLCSFYSESAERISPYYGLSRYRVTQLENEDTFGRTRDWHRRHDHGIAGQALAHAIDLPIGGCAFAGTSAWTVARTHAGDQKDCLEACP